MRRFKTIAIISSCIILGPQVNLLGNSIAIAKTKARVQSNALDDDYVAKHWYDSTTGFAIGGFDTVAYFGQNEIKEGRDDYQFIWRGVSWRFANSGNLRAFKKAPYIYVPRFGGYDAYALSNGILTEGHPSIWEIVDGRLYLFHNETNRYLWQNRKSKIMTEILVNWKKLSLELPRFKIRN